MQLGGLTCPVMVSVCDFRRPQESALDLPFPAGERPQQTFTQVLYSSSLVQRKLWYLRLYFPIPEHPISSSGSKPVPGKADRERKPKPSRVFRGFGGAVTNHLNIDVVENTICLSFYIHYNRY